MRNQSLVSACLAAVLILSAGLSVEAQSSPTVLYRLLEGSTYQEGCFEPCQCPILLPVPLEGTFGLELLPAGGPLATYGVTAVEWNVPVLEKAIAGHGTYVRGGDFQEMTLDLTVGDDPSATYGSGPTDGGGAFPLIELTVNRNQYFCYDVVLHLRAAPSPVAVPELSVTRDELSWTAESAAATWDVVCGDLGYARATGDLTGATDQCLGNAVPGTSIPYAIGVEPGAGVWFLIRDADGGSYDTAGGGQVAPRDPSIDASTAACP